MKKKILFIVLPLIFIGIGIFFAIYYNVPRLTFVYSSYHGGYLVEHAYGDAKEYVIPKTYNEKRVVGFDTRAFYNHQKLEVITFEDEENITYIGRLAFSECKSLKSISLPKLNTIDKSAFYNCIKLESISLGVNHIGGCSFFGCSSLTDVTLTKLDTVGSYAFSECKSLKTLRLPETVTRVYSNSFIYSGLTELYVPKSLQDNDYLKTLDYVKYY